MPLSGVRISPGAAGAEDWDEFPGRFEAPQTVDVRARVGGYIQAVHFQDGDYVRQGQLLFTLDPRLIGVSLRKTF